MDRFLVFLTISFSSRVSASTNEGRKIIQVVLVRANVDDKNEI